MYFMSIVTVWVGSKLAHHIANLLGIAEDLACLVTPLSASLSSRLVSPLPVCCSPVAFYHPLLLTLQKGIANEIITCMKLTCPEGHKGFVSLLQQYTLRILN